MNGKSSLSELVMAFFVCTTCITILEGVVGMLFFPQVELSYAAFFSPPLFGFFSVGFGLINYSRKELGIGQVLFRRLLHLLMIEGLVFGSNYAAGMTFTPVLAGVLAFCVALIFVAVYVVLWFNDRRSAMVFNRQLKIYQKNNE